MAHKTITISEEAYQALAKMKKERESFTDVILRVASSRGSAFGKYRGFHEENTQSRVAKDHGVRKSGCSEIVCLDTSVLVSLLRGEEAAVRRLSEEAERGGTVSTTAVNLCELYAGAYASRDPLKELGRIRRLVSGLDLLDLDVEAARRYGELVNDPALRRSPIGDSDLIIACIALSHGENVATRNVAHFERVPGLGTESW